MGGEPYTVGYGGGGARSSAREGGRGQRQKKTETEHGGSVSGVLCQTAVEGGGRGSGGGGAHLSVHWGGVDEVVVVVGDARSSAREGEKLGPKKNRKPSAPARFRVCPVKRRCRAVEGDSGVVWTRWWWWWWGVRVRMRARGRGWGQKKNENRARRLGFGCALSNGGVGRWREVVGWCGQGGGGGGACAFERAQGGRARAKKPLKPSHYGSVWGMPCQTAL